MDDYRDFLAGKRTRAKAAGFEVNPATLNPFLKPFQRDITTWAVKIGRAALFEECGLGKTLQQLSWAETVVRHTGRPVLILTPLAVGPQTIREAAKFEIGVPVRLCETQDNVLPSSIAVTNYQKLHHFDPTVFGGVVLDESSILKAFMGKTKRALVESFSRTPFRLCCSATPAPNDHMELGNHSAFLGVMDADEMLSRWFINDQSTTGAYRLKGHAADDYWKWVASWAVCLSSPADLGYDEPGYALPPLIWQQHVVTAPPLATDDALFENAKLTATSLYRELRENAAERAGVAKRLVAKEPQENWIIWCNTNAESAILAEMIPGAVEVYGNMTDAEKERRIGWFSGHNCLCKHRVIGAKLAQCETQKPTKGTCENTTWPTKQNLPSTEKPARQKRTAADVSGMPLTLNSGESASPNRKNGVQENAATPDSNRNLESLLSSTNCCSDSKAESVQFAEQAKPTKEGIGSTSITAIPPEKSVDCSVQTVTLDSVNSKTTQSKSSERPCTCGHISGRRVLIGKPSQLGHGLNWQHCRREIFVGLTYSYEQIHQAVRRCWRFGQTQEVHAHLVTCDGEGDVVAAVDRKQKDHVTMLDSMIAATKEIGLGGDGGQRPLTDVARNVASGDGWKIHLGDACDVAKELESESVGLTIFSPPFSTLYIYSEADADMGNCADDEEFMRHFGYLVSELFRVTIPGRLCVVHCKDLPKYRGRDGEAGLKDFPGELVRLFESHGWTFHSRCTIWKCPVTEMERTKNHGLLYKSYKRDRSAVRQGMADYLIVFRRPSPDGLVSASPVTSPHDYTGDAGPDAGVTHPCKFARKSASDPALAVWQRYAEPVWWDIAQTDVLNVRQARDDRDEKHLCPLQLGVVRRCVRLWSNPGDVVMTPFAGIGTEVVVAVEEGRHGVGIELKDSYWRAACRNAEAAAAKLRQPSLFDGAPEPEELPDAA